MKAVYLERSTKKTRQELLNKILAEQMEELRKRCFPHQHRSFLLQNVKIEERIFDDNSTLGLYQKIELNDYDYYHLIQIKKVAIWGSQRLKQRYYRKQYLGQLRQAIRHELCHAFIEERYEKVFPNITDKNADASPIFLSFLEFTDTITSHSCHKAFVHTDNYIETSDMIYNFKEWEDYAITTLKQYNNAIIPLLKADNIEEFAAKKTNDLITIVNNFSFAPREAGMEKLIEAKCLDIVKTYDRKINKFYNTVRTWEIGCNVTPEQIKELYDRKQDSQAKYYDYKKNLNLMVDTNVKNMKRINIKAIKNYD